jgi:hypothetical protein
MVQTLPAVRGIDSQPRVRLLSFIAGSAAAGLVTGAALAVIGGMLRVDGHAPAILLAVTVWAALAQSGMRSIRPQFDRQVPRGWQRTLPSPVYSALYGALIGGGIATRIPHATFYLVIAIAVAVDVSNASLVMLTYALSRSLAIVAASMWVRGGNEVRLSLSLQGAGRFVDRANTFYLGLTALSLAGVVWAGL